MISDHVLGMFELSNDLLYHKIPPERRSYYVSESLRLGREAAIRLAADGDGDVSRLYEKAGITITYQDKSGQNYGVSFRAQSEYDKNGEARVMIYTGSIRELANHSHVSLCDGEEQIPALDEDTALKVHLAHEYFHYLEFQNGFVSDSLEQVALTRILKWRRMGGILRASEIAAHAFAKELLGLPVLPNYYDYAYLCAEKKIRREDFLVRVREYS